jgi:hypothetical protein
VHFSVAPEPPEQLVVHPDPLHKVVVQLLLTQTAPTTPPLA